MAQEKSEVKMKRILFWDVDTQYDFMRSDGKLYVTDAEDIIPTLALITNYAREHNILIWGSVDYHNPDDPEISDQPDFYHTFPNHCEKNTPGQEKIDATKPLNPLWIDSQPQDKKVLEEMISQHEGEVIFRKQKFDVFTNPNVIPALEFLKPNEVYVYGVALDVCNAFAIEGFLKMKRFEISLITDATKPIHKERAEILIKKWEADGVGMVNSDTILSNSFK
jgi:nicotinamidase-related amidase